MGKGIANKSKTALVTGSSKGIGKKIAETLEDEGYIVIYHATNENSFDITYNNKNIFVKNFSQLDKLVDEYTELYKKYSGIDVLVLNAAIGKPESFLSEKEEYLREIINVNIQAQIMLIQTHLKLHRDELEEGQLIFVSSVAGNNFRTHFPYYSMTKAAMTHYCKIMSQKYNEHRVRINIVSPGSIETEMTIKAIKEYSIKMNISVEEAKEKLYTNINCLNDMGEVDDVAEIVKFLVSSKSKFINGENICINGGYKYE